MTNSPSTDATAMPWREALRRDPERYAACSPEAISHGSQAQMKYFVADAQHDIAILATRLADVERERDEALKRYAEAEQEWKYDCSQRVNDIKRALDAEDRVAVLEEALAEVLDMYFPMSGPTAVKQPPLILEARTALAAEQKEAGK